MKNIETFNNFHPIIHPSVFIHKQATIIGNVFMDEECSVWPHAVLRGDVQAISVGKRTNIQDGSILHVTHDSIYNPKGLACKVGDDVTIGHRATLHACNIHDKVLIGMHALIMDGAVVESECMIAAGSLVPPNKYLESGYLWLGSPIKKIRPLTEEEKEFINYSAQHYVKLKNQYLKNKSAS